MSWLAFGQEGTNMVLVGRRNGSSVFFFFFGHGSSVPGYDVVVVEESIDDLPHARKT